MSNKKLGNSFETEFCEVLSEQGFWVHNLAQNSAGQPADVIAVKDGESFLIDCKVCSQGRFPFSRIEENQELSMDLWCDCGNGQGWFALKFDTHIYMVGHHSIRACAVKHSVMTRELADMYGYTLEEWLWNRR